MSPKMGLDNDEIFGGWLNLDSYSQFFSCVPGSHIPVKLKNIPAGFDTLQKRLKDCGITENSKQKEYMKQVKSYSTKIEVPPGHLVIFPQYILHEVLNVKAAYDMMRLFVGWRITTAIEPLVKIEKANEFGVIPLPGGMLPAMYSKQHIMAFREKEFNIVSGLKYSLESWSCETFKDENVSVKNKYKLVDRFMKSLEEVKLDDVYSKYNEEECAIYGRIVL